MTGCCLVLGAGGRVGRLLRGVWPNAVPDLAAVFQSRHPGDGIDLVADLDDNFARTLGAGPEISALFVLAGVTTGTPSELAENSRLAIWALNLAQSLAIPKVILCSSAAVYRPLTEHPPFQETDTITSDRPYGQAKLAMEASARTWWSQAERPMQITCLRMANMVGADMLADSARRATVAEPLVLDQFPDGGSPERAYLSPRTCAAVVASMATALPRPGFAVLNLADTGGAVAMHKLLEKLADHGISVPWRWSNAPQSAIRQVALDTSELRARLPNCAALHHATTADRLVREWLDASGGTL